MEAIKKAFSWKAADSSHRLMLLAILVLGVFSFFWGEKVPAGGGLGWDGLIYGAMVRNLGSMISGGQLSAYYAQRILPSAIVREMMILFRVPMSNEDIIRSFEIYNLVLLVGACWAWKRVANALDLSVAGRWIGFCGIFVSFECSKFLFYYPVLTDATTLFVALLLLLFYVEKRPLPLFAVTILGAFAYPIVSLCGALLLLFLKSDLPKDVVTPASSKRSATMAHRALRVIIVLCALPVIGYVILALVAPLPARAIPLPARVIAHAGPQVASHLTEQGVLSGLEKLFTSLPSDGIMLIALAMLAGSARFVPAVFAGIRRAKPALVALAAAAILVPFLVVKAISNPAIENANNLKVMISWTLFPQAGKFLLPFVTLAAFWGPALLLMILYWKAFCVEARKMGPGVMAIMAMCMLLALACEPRFFSVAWPFFVLALVMVFEKVHVQKPFKYAFAFLTVLYAQFWMKLNLAPWTGSDLEGLQDFPKQIFFMHQGLWMSWWSYWMYLIAMVVSAIWFYKTIGKVRTTESAPKI